VYGVEGEWGAQQVLADAFEASTVTAVDRGGGVEIHAVGERDEALRSRHGGGSGRRGQGQLNARGEGRVNVDLEVVGQSGVGDVGRDGIEHADEVALVQVGQGMEDDVAVGLLLEGAVGGQDVEVDKEAEVSAKPLDDGDDAGVQVTNRTQAVVPLGETTQGLHQPASEATADRVQRSDVVSEADCQGRVEREHPLPIGHLGQQVVNPVRCGLAHAPTDARRAYPPTLTRERDA
jgi:hypothetical protein